MHHRIAARYGILDVDAVANSLNRDQTLEHEAVALIDGWHHGRQLEASIVAAIHNAITDMLIFQSEDSEKAAKKLKYKSSFEVLNELTEFSKKKRKKSSTKTSIRDFEKRVSRR